MNLPMLAHDKANHVVYGGVLAFVGVVVGLKAAPVWAPLVGLALAVGAGLVKEALDWLSNREAARLGDTPPHEIGLGDFLATAFGGAVIALTAYLA